MRYNMNVLDSSIRFGTKLKWSRLFKYRNRGMTIALPPHIRIHGHGGLGRESPPTFFGVHNNN